MVRALAAEGARVAVADISIDHAVALAKEIGESALAVHVDVGDRASVDAMVEKVVNQFGRLDIIVNNATVFDLAPIMEITEQNFDRLFSINVKGLLFCVQAAATDDRAGTWRQDHQYGIAGRSAR